jgi:hypothetical protein
LWLCLGRYWLWSRSGADSTPWPSNGQWRRRSRRSLRGPPTPPRQISTVSCPTAPPAPTNQSILPALAEARSIGRSSLWHGQPRAHAVTTDPHLGSEALVTEGTELRRIHHRSPGRRLAP